MYLSVATKLDDLITKHGSVFVFHHPGSFLHLLFQTGDLLFLFGLGHLHATAALSLGSGRGNFDQVPDRLTDRLGHDSIGLIKSVLNAATTLRFIDGGAHGRRHIVRVHDDPAFGISGCPTDGLDQAGLTAQEAFLVRIQNRYQTDFRQVKTFPEQVDANEYIEFRHTKVTDDFHSLHGADVRVHIAHLDACFCR